MVQAFALSVRLGPLPASGRSTGVRGHSRGLGLPTRLADVSNRPFPPDALLAAMGRDKKVEDGRLRFVLARRIGEAFTSADVPPRRGARGAGRGCLSHLEQPGRAGSRPMYLSIAGRRPAARRQRLLRRGRVRAGQGARHPDRGAGRAGSSAARLACRILKHLEAYLAACQLGITMASLGLGWVGEPAVAAAAGAAVPRCWAWASRCCTPSRSCVGFLLFSSLHIVIGEQVPKTLRDPSARADLALGGARRCTPSSALLAAELGAQRRVARHPPAASAWPRPATTRSISGDELRELIGASRAGRRGAQAGARHAGRRSSTSRSSRSARS